MAIKAEQVNVNQISFGALEDSSYVKSQKQAFINHKNQKLLSQTPYFLTETYGVPRAGEYYQTLKSRAFFKMPLCDDRREFPAEVEYDAIRSFREKLLEVDEMMASSETKNKLFGDNNNDELLTIKKVEEENKEDNTKNIYLSQRAEILSKQEERVKEDLNTQQEQTTKNEENISTENP